LSAIIWIDKRQIDLELFLIIKMQKYFLSLLRVARVCSQKELIFADNLFLVTN